MTIKKMNILSEIQQLEIKGGKNISDIGFHTSCNFVHCYNLSCINGECINDACSNGYCNNTGVCGSGLPIE